MGGLHSHVHMKTTSLLVVAIANTKTTRQNLSYYIKIFSTCNNSCIKSHITIYLLHLQIKIVEKELKPHPVVSSFHRDIKALNFNTGEGPRSPINESEWRNFDHTASLPLCSPVLRMLNLQRGQVALMRSHLSMQVSWKWCLHESSLSSVPFS